MQSYIYVIAAETAPPCKIGHSVDPRQRLRKLQTGNRDPLILCHTVAVTLEQASLLEKLIHRTLRHCRLRGEWFNLTVEQACAELECALIRYGDVDLKAALRHQTSAA